MLIWILSKFIQVGYQIKYRKAGDDLPVLLEVVKSCDTVESCDAAAQHLKIYKAKHLTGVKEDGYTRTAERVMVQLTLFIDDTREHCEFGMHHPKHNGGLPLATFPDMNNYVGKVLDVRF